MKLYLNSQEYVLSEQAEFQLLQAFFSQGHKFYQELDLTKQLLADQVARGLLYDAEKKMLEKGVSPEIAMQIRPAKSENAAEKFIDVLAMNMSLPLQSTEVHANVEGNVITGFAYQFKLE